MKLYGITGGIGAGKSATIKTWIDLDWAVIDTDDIARELVQPGQDALNEIIAAFGDTVLGADGHLDRKELARKVFENAEARVKLEGILHPRIRDRWTAQVDGWVRSGRQKGVVIIPLLFETAAEKFFDRSVCIACGLATQKRRLSARGWSDVEISQRLSAQWSIDEKMNRADFVVWNESNLEILNRQIEWISQHN